MKKILVADDEMACRLLFSEELKEEGYEVFLASNGREALEIAKKVLLDLVILDIKMPEMDGIEALRQIKEHWPDMPVILNTAYGEYKQDFATWDSDEYFVKSSDTEDLIAAVKRLLDERILHSSEERIQEKINEDLNILISSQKENDLMKSYALRIKDYREQGFLPFFSEDEILKLFNAKKKLFKTELLKARKIIKAHLLSHTSETEAENLFSKEKLSVLTFDRFKEEAERLNNEFMKESYWLLEQLIKICDLLTAKGYASIPFENLKNAILFHDIQRGEEEKIISVVMADIRHDLRNLITRIKLKYDIEEVNALESILERLYSIPFLEVKASFSLVDIRDIIDSIVEQINLKKPKGISIRVICDDFQALTDPNLLGVALRQVLQNSMEAMSQEHVELVVTPTYRQQADQQTINFHITDTGCGIPAEVLAKIFNPQFSYNKKNSTGMGLTLAKLAVSALGGTIQVSSKVGKGTDVDITIPLVTI